MLNWKYFLGWLPCSTQSDHFSGCRYSIKAKSSSSSRAKRSIFLVIIGSRPLTPCSSDAKRSPCLAKISRKSRPPVRKVCGSSLKSWLCKISGKCCAIIVLYFANLFIFMCASSTSTNPSFLFQRLLTSQNAPVRDCWLLCCRDLPSLSVAGRRNLSSSSQPAERSEVCCHRAYSVYIERPSLNVASNCLFTVYYR